MPKPRGPVSRCWMSALHQGMQNAGCFAVHGRECTHVYVVTLCSMSSKHSLAEDSRNTNLLGWLHMQHLTFSNTTVHRKGTHTHIHTNINSALTCRGHDCAKGKSTQALKNTCTHTHIQRTHLYTGVSNHIHIHTLTHMGMAMLRRENTLPYTHTKE